MSTNTETAADTMAPKLAALLESERLPLHQSEKLSGATLELLRLKAKWAKRDGEGHARAADLLLCAALTAAESELTPGQVAARVGDVVNECEAARAEAYGAAFTAAYRRRPTASAAG